MSLVIAFSISGAAGAGTPSTHSRAQGADARVSAPDSNGVLKREDVLRRDPRGKCPSAHKAIKFYARRINELRARMGATELTTIPPRAGCPRYLAHVLQRKAHWLRLRFYVWHRYHFEWTMWLPDKWQRIGACETGYGRRPGSWTWDSGTYVSAFGIYRAGYAQFAHAIGQLSWDETRLRLGRYPTPREQYNVAMEIWRRYGFSGWGCRNA